MTTKEFLSDNREEVINYYNNEIKGYWNISIKDFMTDLLTNFRKVTISEGLKRMDLTSNLIEAKSRLGLMDRKIEATDKATERLQKKYEGTAYMALV